jgi:hypothetical protein
MDEVRNNTDIRRLSPTLVHHHRRSLSVQQPTDFLYWLLTQD